MSKVVSNGLDLTLQFKKLLGWQYSVDDIKQCVKIGSEALSNGTLDTREHGAGLLNRLVLIEHLTLTDEKTLKDLYQILIKSGASQQINGTSVNISLEVNPLIHSIAHHTPIMFGLLLSCPSIDLNVSGFTGTPLITATGYRREDMVKALCVRFYEIDFAVSFNTTGDNSYTALTYASKYELESIRTLIETAVNVDLPKYKNSVNNLLFDLGIPNVLIPIIGLYAFF